MIPCEGKCRPLLFELAFVRGRLLGWNAVIFDL